MRKFIMTLVVTLFVAAGIMAQTKNYGHGLQEYKLPNGLTVYLWEDKDASECTGFVAFRAGSADEPIEYTGLAHYLEHMLFKGTNKIGAIDWAKEEPLYKDIIALYDRFNAETDEAKRLELTKQINEKSMEAAKYVATNDFSNLTESYGGTGLNAYTSNDQTVYFNYFPASAMEKWLELNSERLINPVFRSFQAELENVYEEFNMGMDNDGRVRYDFRCEHAYKGNPYERSVIGYQKHLKNPSLSALINFYNTWYVANNMCLVIVGNFDAEAAKPMIAEKFGRIPSKKLPERAEYPMSNFEGNPVVKTKLGYQPSYEWIYKGVKKGDPDELALYVTISLLSNAHSTGLLDRLNLDGTVGGVQVGVDSRRLDGNIIFMANPYYDPQTRMFETKNQTHNAIFKEVDKLKNEATIPDWLFTSVKNMLLQQYVRMFEADTYDKAEMVAGTFIYNTPTEDIFNESEQIAAITKADVVRCANKYLSGNFLTLEFTEGTTKKTKLAKPQIKPLDYPKGAESPYGKEFKKIPVTPVEAVFSNFDEVTERQLFNNVKMFYTPNTKNDIFSLTLKYGVGNRLMPKLEYASYLMNMAGMMPNVSAQEVRRQYSELGATFGFGSDDDYFYISLMGEEKNLDQILSLVSRHVMMPNLDDNQVKSMVSGLYWSRYSEKRNPNIVASALQQYVLYGEKSAFIDRIPMDELYSYSIVGDAVVEKYLVNKTNLTTTIQEATGYAVEAYYCGRKPVDEVAKSLNAIPMQSVMKNTESPYYKERKVYDKTNVILLGDSKMQQAKIYFYAGSNPYEIKDDVKYHAFGQYFNGGFSGLVMNEVREKRSMAYTAYGTLYNPGFVGKPSYLYGYIGTQSDKVADAIDVFMGLVNDMPDYPDRIDNIKNFIEQLFLISRPDMRSKAALFEQWKRIGYTDDPSKVNMQAVKDLTYDDIRSFYEANVKDRPMTIMIIGDPKGINMKQIQAKYGKVQKVNVNKLFKGGI